MKNDQNQGRNKLSVVQIILMILAVYAAAMATWTFIGQSKIGYIDSNILMQEYSGAVEAKAKLEKETAEYRANIQTLEKELTELNKAFTEQGVNWNKNKLKSKKAELEKKQQEYMRYSRAVSEKAAKKEKELLQEVFDELNAYIQDFGKDKGYDILWGTVAGGNILYGNDSKNMTKEFLEYIKEKM